MAGLLAELASIHLARPRPENQRHHHLVHQLRRALPARRSTTSASANYTSMFTGPGGRLDRTIISPRLVFIVAVTMGRNGIALLLAHKLPGRTRRAAGLVLAWEPEIALRVTVVGLI